MFRRVGIAVAAGALALTGAALAATPTFYQGTTSQKIDPSCTSSCTMEPFSLNVQGGKVIGVMFSAHYKGPRRCATLTNDTFGSPQLVVRHGRLSGTMRSSRYDSMKIQATISGGVLTGSFSSRTEFLNFRGSRLVSVGPTCRTGVIHFTAHSRAP